VFYDEVYQDIPEDVLREDIDFLSVVHRALHAVAHGDGLAEDVGGDGGERGDVRHVGAVQAEHLGASLNNYSPQACTVELYYGALLQLLRAVLQLLRAVLQLLRAVLRLEVRLEFTISGVSGS